jgi:hypothetical protein
MKTYSFSCLIYCITQKTRSIIFIFLFFLFENLLYAGVSSNASRIFNSKYSGDYLNRVAYPIGGIGAGMICLEGTGAISHVSVRNAPDIFNEPYMFAALFIKNENRNIAKVIEGPVPEWKYFGQPESGNGFGGSSYGFPRFDNAVFISRFPFGYIDLKDNDIPFKVKVTGWSPFIPGDTDNSSLPVGALEYQFSNPTDQTREAIFSYNSQNFMQMPVRTVTSRQFEPGELIKEFPDGFLLWRDGTIEHP